MPQSEPRPIRPAAAAAGRSRRGRGAASEARILDAAEELFATNGFALTSLRAIAAAAEVELGLIGYYFGAKRQLVEKVLARRALRGAIAMGRALDEVEAAGRGDDAAAILTAFCESILAPLEREHRGAINYVRLVVQRGGDLLDAVGEDPVLVSHRPLRARYVAALERALPDLDPADLRFGFEVFEGAISRMLFDRGVDVHDAVLRRARVAEMRRCLVPFCAAGFAGLSGDPRSSARREGVVASEGRRPHVRTPVAA